jgi:hypothetical protein
MGCASGSPTSEPARGAGGQNSAAKKGMMPTIQWCYLDLLARGDLLQQQWDYHGQPHQKKAYPADAVEWGAKRARGEGGEFGGLPQVDMVVKGKKVNMGQAMAILRSFGIMYGYYNPKDWKACMLIDPIVETYSDVLAGAGGVVFNPNPDKGPLIAAYVDGICTKFMALCEANLAKHGGKFIAGPTVTIADFAMSCFVHNMLQNSAAPWSGALQAKFTQFPKLCVYAKVCNDEFAAQIKKRGPVGPA